MNISTKNISFAHSNAQQPSGTREEFLDIIRANRNVLLSLTGNRFTVELGDRTAFDHSRRAVMIGQEQLISMGVENREELLFITLHELGHLKEFMDDPDGYLRVIEACRVDPDGDEVFTFYNSLMDIYVNRNAANKAAVYRSKDEYSPLIKDLYLNKAFPEHDLSQLPLAEQYADYFLLTGMGVHRAYTVSPEIKEIFDRGVPLGEKLTYEEFIESILVPALGNNRSAAWQATIGQRDALIRATVLPIYRELLERDKREGRHENRKIEPGGDPSGHGITKHLSPNEVKELIEALREIIKEENLSNEALAQRDLNRQARQIAEAANLDNPTDFAERLCRVQPTVNKLVKAFLEFRAPSKTLTRKLSYHSNQGVLDVPEATRKFGRILRDPANAEVMRQERIVAATEKTPINIRICLLPDMSSSMSSCLDGLRDNVIALAAAGATLSQMHKRQGSGIVSELGVYGFESSLHEILEPRPDASLTDVAEAYQKLQPLGGTAEHLALEHVIEKLPVFGSRDMRRGTDRNVVNLVISITDGETEEPARSIAAKNTLHRLGCEPFGIFLGSSGCSGGTFREIWGDRGYQIDAVEELPRVIQQILQSTAGRK